MSPEHCATQLVRLMTLKGVPEDTSEYFPALADIPELVFTDAIAHALKTRIWFPVPAELRVDCDVAAAHFRMPVPAEPKIEAVAGGGRTVTIPNPFGGDPLVLKVDRIWRFDCDDCGDTGWRSRQCPDMACGRRFDHAAHEWVDRCQCIDTNPTIQRYKASQTKYAAEKATTR